MFSNADFAENNQPKIISLPLLACFDPPAMRNYVFNPILNCKLLNTVLAKNSNFLIEGTFPKTLQYWDRVCTEKDSYLRWHENKSVCV